MNYFEEEGYYTKSYGEFEQKYNNDNAYRDKVFDVVASRDGHLHKKQRGVSCRSMQYLSLK
jgi:hypothetical protein